MTVVTKEKTAKEEVFIAEDGTEFSRKGACLEYEADTWLEKHALNEDRTCFSITMNEMEALENNLEFIHGYGSISTDVSDFENYKGDDTVKVILIYDDEDEVYWIRSLENVLKEKKGEYDYLANL